MGVSSNSCRSTWTCVQLANVVSRMVQEAAVCGEVPNFKADPEGETSIRKKVFEGESIPLHYTRAWGTYQNDPKVTKLSHTSVIEIAAHFLACEIAMACSVA